MKSPFWQGALELQRALNIPRFGFLWTNLLCCDQGKTTPMTEFHDVIRKHSPFRAELETLKPDVVIFFTGRWYDYTIKRYFPGCKFEQVGQSSRLLDRIIFPDAPRLMLRTYHPKYLLLGRFWDTIKTIAEFVKAEQRLEGSTLSV
jgi:hypothetical protein